MESMDCKSCLNENCLIKKHHANLGEHLVAKHTLVCKKGQQFILEGGQVHGLYFIYEGKVKMAKTGIKGREQITRFASEGEIIGHRGFGTGEFYQINAEAIVDTVLCVIDNSTIRDMLKTAPDLTYNLMLFYADELNKSETKVQKFAQMTVRERVIDAILYIHRKFGQKNGLLTIQFSRKEIANFAGTTDEQVIRVISSLKKDKVLYAKGKKIGVLDMDRLKAEIADHNYFLGS